MGAFGGHFGPFQSDFRPQSKKLGPIGSLFLYCLATEMTWRLLNLVQWDRGWHFCTGRGLWRPFWVAKWVKSGIQIGPSLFLWGLKSLWNGPKWSPKAPKGPTPVQYGNTLYHCTRFWAIQTLYWAQINEETGSKMAQTGPNPLACLGGRKSIGQLLALHFLTFSHLYIHRGSDLNKKNCLVRTFIKGQGFTHFECIIVHSLYVNYLKKPPLTEVLTHLFVIYRPFGGEIHWESQGAFFFSLTLLMKRRVLLLTMCCHLHFKIWNMRSSHQHQLHAVSRLRLTTQKMANTFMMTLKEGHLKLTWIIHKIFSLVLVHLKM